MDKNWLIRTKSNHILGPISKEKLIELIKNNSILPDDEICSGNGYWFFLRESELVEKYIYGSESQTFNPVSEAPDVLTLKENEGIREADDITMVGKVDLKLLNQLKSSDVQTIDSKKNSKKAVKKFQPKKTSYLKIVFISLILIFLILISFRSKVMSLIISKVTTELWLNESHAQFNPLEDLKKKELFPDQEFDQGKVSLLLSINGPKIAVELKSNAFNCRDHLRFIDFIKRNYHQTTQIPCLQKKTESSISVPSFSPKLEGQLFNRYHLIIDKTEKEKLEQELGLLGKDDFFSGLIRSLIYLKLGNISRSDEVLVEMTKKSFFELAKSHKSFSLENLRRLLTYLGKHPSDRRFFKLFLVHLSNYVTEPSETELLRSFIDEQQASEILGNSYLSRTFGSHSCLSMSDVLTKIKLSHQIEEFCKALFFPNLILLDDESIKELDFIQKTYPIEWLILMSHERTAAFVMKKKVHQTIKEKHLVIKNLSQSAYRDYFILSLGDWDLL